jgi:predicted Rossmann-fold nucleotide-binding protein
MAAMNDGALAGNGHVVGVIHSMFLVDGGYGVDGDAGAEGAHQMFAKTNPDNRDGPIREILVAGGDDLQERKKMLVDKADALVVLPGGPGTWDEVRLTSLESRTHIR